MSGYKSCGYCTFIRYNLSYQESRNGWLRATPIHKAGSGSSFEEMYLRRINNSGFLLIVDSAHVHIERPVKFCPCCGRDLRELVEKTDPVRSGTEGGFPDCSGK